MYVALSASAATCHDSTVFPISTLSSVFVFSTIATPLAQPHVLTAFLTHRSKSQWGNRMRHQVYDYLFSTEFHTLHDTYTHFGGTIGIQKLPKVTIDRWYEQFVLRGHWRTLTTKEKKRMRKRSECAQHMPEDTVAAIKEIVDTEPRLYLDEIQTQLEDLGHSRWGTTTIYIALTTRVKDEDGRPYSLTKLRRLAKQASLRRQIAFRITTRDIPARCFVFVDESQINKSSTRRRRGWSPRGRQTNVVLPFGQGDIKYTLLAAANLQGFVFTACKALEGINDGETFCEWVEHDLCPHLGSWLLEEENSVVVLDNAPIHHALYERIERLVRACGARIIFLPPYSPMLNPIEEAFQQYKAYHQRNWQRAKVDPDRIMFEALLNVSSANMAGYFRHAGLKVPAAATRALAGETHDEECAAAAIVAAVAAMWIAEEE